MFKRVILEEWASVVPILAFVTLFTVFLVTTLRAIRLSPEQRSHMADLPLTESQESSES